MNASLNTTTRNHNDTGGNGAVGFSGDGGPATKATLNSPGRVATRSSAGNVYFNDYYNHRLRKIALDGTITTVAGNGGTADSGDGGSATAAGVATPKTWCSIPLEISSSRKTRTAYAW